MTEPRQPGPPGGRPVPPPAHARQDAHPQHLSLHHPARADLEARRRRGVAEPSGIRMVVALAGLASASALATAMLPSILPKPVAVTSADVVAADAAASQGSSPSPAPSVIHVTRVVTLAPGQTLPPDALAGSATAATPTTPGATPRTTPAATPRPTPRIIVQTATRQSGKP